MAKGFENSFELEQKCCSFLALQFVGIFHFPTVKRAQMHQLLELPWDLAMKI